MTLLGFLRSLVDTEAPCTTQGVEIRGTRMELKRCELPSKISYSLYAINGVYSEGDLILLKQDEERAAVVDYVTVDNNRQKNGVGTFLYETAAKDACRLGYTLKSSDYRSEFSEAFWQKQARKGRASCEVGWAGFFHTPFEEARRATQNTAQFEEMATRLPKPQVSKDADRYWPCNHYRIDNPCEMTSLAGIKSKRRRK